MITGRAVVPSRDILFMTLDSLRLDVAEQALADGSTPNLKGHLPGGAWERRHSPGSFTFAAHQAFFAGFLPTPERPERHERLFALRFTGSRSTGPGTLVFDAPDIVSGLSSRGYHTLCIGGTGFFNEKTPLGAVLPRLFAERHWREDLGVTALHSTRAQVRLACDRVAALDPDRRVFLFVNVSATHHPTRIYRPGARADSADTQRAALAYVDGELPALFASLSAERSWLCILCADHGTAFGDDGYSGHRLGHPSVWSVPYAEFLLDANGTPERTPEGTA